MSLRTIHRKRIKLAMRRAEPLEVERPRIRADCVDGTRPCPWVGCRHHLYLEVKANGSIVLNRPDLEPWDLEHSCSLDSPRQLEGWEIARALGITRRRVYQILPVALVKIASALGVELPCQDEEAQAPYRDRSRSHPGRR